jgi:hypothetical protein
MAKQNFIKYNKYKGLHIIPAENIQVEDASLNSPDYFRLEDFPQTLTAGKNMFKIAGNTETLASFHEIEVECISGDGKPVYIEIPDYLDANGMRMVTLWVYPWTSSGFGMITLVSKRKDGGIVRWRRLINIDPSKANDTQIIFGRKPRVFIKEVEKEWLTQSYYQGSAVTSSFTGQISNAYINGTSYVYSQGTGDSIGPQFTSDMVGGTLTVTSPNYTLPAGTTVIQSGPSETNPVPSLVATVTSVPDALTLIIDKPLMINNVEVCSPPMKNQSNPSCMVVPSYVVNAINNSNYELQWSQDATFATGSNNKESYAHITLANIDPIAGDVQRVKTYMRSHGFLNWNLVGDDHLDFKELLIDGNSHELTKQMGTFKGSGIISTYWSSSAFGYPLQSTDQYPSLTRQSSSLMDSMRISGSEQFNYASNRTLAKIKVENKIPIDFYKDNQYQISFKVNRSSDTVDLFPPEMQVYMSGSSFDYTDDNEFGKHVVTLGAENSVATWASTIAQIGPDNNQIPAYIPTHTAAREGSPPFPGSTSQYSNEYMMNQLFQAGTGQTPSNDTLTYTITADRDGTGVPVFEVNAGIWEISEISIQSVNLFGYTPNHTFIMTHVPNPQQDDILDFKFEFYSDDGTKANVTLVSESINFAGSNTYIQNAQLVGPMFMGPDLDSSGFEFSSAASAFIRTTGPEYPGFSYATGSGGGGLILWSGSLSAAGKPYEGKGNYHGVGMELVGKDAWLRFRTATGSSAGAGSELDITTDTFFLGHSGSSFISGSGDGTIAISSSNFELTTEGDVTMQGTITATAGGTIGGFAINSDNLAATNFILNTTDKSLTLGTGNTIFIADADDGIQLGHATFADAPFSVTTAGALKAESGEVAGWTIGSTQIQGGALVLDKAGIIRTDPFISNTDGGGFILTAEAGGYLEVQNAKIRGTFATTVFEKESINAVGGQLWVANATTISSSAWSGSGVMAYDTTMSVENVTGFASGEICQLKKITNTGFSTEYIRINSSSRYDNTSENDLTGKIMVTRGMGTSPSAGTDSGSLGAEGGAATAYSQSQVIVSTGKTGSGYIRLNANPNDERTPYMDIVERTGSGVYDVSLKARLGDLSGIEDNSFSDGVTGFGLYSENVYLKGKLEVTNPEGSSMDQNFGGPSGSNALPISKLVPDGEATGSQWFQSPTTRHRVQNGVLFMSSSNTADTWDGELRSKQQFNRRDDHTLVVDITIKDITGAHNSPRMMIGWGSAIHKTPGYGAGTYSNNTHAIYFHTNDITIYEDSQNQGTFLSNGVAAGDKFRCTIKPNQDNGAVFNAFKYPNLSSSVAYMDTHGDAQANEDEFLDVGIWCLRHEETFTIDSIQVTAPGQQTTVIEGDKITTGKIRSTNLAATQGTEIDLDGETVNIGGTSVTHTAGTGIFMDGGSAGAPTFKVGSTTQYAKYDTTLGLQVAGDITVTGGSITGSLMDFPSEENLIAYYPLHNSVVTANGFDRVLDYSGNERHGEDDAGSISGGTVFVSGSTAGPLPGAAWFDGTDSRIDINAFSAALTANMDLSISFWVRKTNTTQDVYPFGFHDGGANDLIWQMDSGGAQVTKLLVNSTILGTITVPTTHEFTNLWRHVVIVIEDGAQAKLYVDGQDMGNYTTANAETANIDDVDEILLGGELDGAGGAPTNDFTGYISEYRVYNTILTGDNCKALFNMPAGPNSSGTKISGDMISTGKIQSNNWAADAGSQIDLDNGIIKMGGSTSPTFEVTSTGIATATALRNRLLIIDSTNSGSFIVTVVNSLQYESTLYLDGSCNLGVVGSPGDYPERISTNVLLNLDMIGGNAAERDTNGYTSGQSTMTAWPGALWKIVPPAVDGNSNLEVSIQVGGGVNVQTTDGTGEDGSTYTYSTAGQTSGNAATYA